jgi:C-terminal processing protease CtpA/Prc
MHQLHRRDLYAALVSAIIFLPWSLPAQMTQRAPPWWGVAGNRPADFEVVRDTLIHHDGIASIRIVSEIEPCGFATLVTQVPAAEYAGRHVRFSAFLHSIDLTGGGGVIWERADDASNRVVAFSNTQATPILNTSDWTQVEVALDVPATATRISMGVYSAGRGSLWVDDAQLESDGAPTLEFGFEDPATFVAPMNAKDNRCEPAHALSTRSLANLEAFTFALGYVRFFHPSAAGLRVNWDEFAIAGISSVEAAPDAVSLASALRRIFASIAPTVEFTPTALAKSRSIPRPAGATHVIFWEHDGVGAPSGGPAPKGMQSSYQSRRTIAPLAAVGTPVALPTGVSFVHDASVPLVPDPAHPLQVALEGGVTISVPLALYTADSAVPDSMTSPRPDAATVSYSANDRATRLADVALAWSLLRQFYPYFKIVNTDWLAALRSALGSAATDDNSTAFQITLERLIASLHDGHGSVYYPSPNQAVPPIGLGWTEGKIVVTANGDFGAAKGFRTGDILVTVDGVPASTTLAAKSALISGATPQWIRARALGELLLGPRGSVANLRFADSAGGLHNVELVRSSSHPAQAAPHAKIAQLQSGLMYVDLGQITDSDFAAALPRLQRADGIVFDMRGYPSRVNTAAILAHFTDTTIHSARFLMPVQTVPDQRQVGYVDESWNLKPTLPRLHARLAFLIGGSTISYAESTIGVVESYKLGAIIGEPTAGTNGDVNPFELPGGYTVVWTGLMVQKRDGTPHHGVGILPTVPAAPTIADVRAGRDRVLERAILLLTAESRSH